MAGGGVNSLRAPGLWTYLVRHPSGALTLARAGWPLRASGWWRRPPFLPLPDATYWDFRMTTYGTGVGAIVTPAVMVDAAEWSLRQRERR
jgi:hypothetical protein